MRKICFSERYGLHQAVLKGNKMQTRRIVPKSELDRMEEYNRLYNESTLEALKPSELVEQFFFTEKIGKFPYKIGDVVAIAERYKDAGINFIPEEDDEFGCYNFPAEQTTGWTNKMFVRADLMPHRIRITNVRVERLQDISEEDCIKEGVVKIEKKIPTQAPQFITSFYPCQSLKDDADKLGWGRTYDSPQKAFAVLIDRISGKDTWKSNPLVYVYDFTLEDSKM